MLLLLTMTLTSSLVACGESGTVARQNGTTTQQTGEQKELAEGISPIADEYRAYLPKYEDEDDDWFSGLGWSISKSEPVGGGIVNSVVESATVDSVEGYDDFANDYIVGYDDYDDDEYIEIDFNTENYDSIEESGFRKVSLSPLSTFGADVDTASYSNFRRFVNYGNSVDEIPSGSIRTEEMINYFTYDYNGPEDNEPFGINTEISECPWNEDHVLMTIGLQTEKFTKSSEIPDSNIVFLIDTSGSMFDENKLPLLIDSFKLMTEELGKNDRISIVTYAGTAETLLEGVSGTDKEEIFEALDSLSAGGYTNGGEGIIRAYELAEENFIVGGNNRVILATDGDLNVGITDQSKLVELVQREGKENNIYLTCLGFGTGNYNDANMEAMADHGNGNYAYIDSIDEAKKVLVQEFAGTMFCVAKDTKLQVEFNPLIVSEYRLVGYEDREMAAEDFDNDKKDGGEIGMGHDVTVVYELELNTNYDMESGLRYQTSALTESALTSGEWCTLAIRYKEPNEDTSELLEYPIGYDSYAETPSDQFRFITDVVMVSEILRNSEYAKANDLDEIIDDLESLKLSKTLDKEKDEFVELLTTLKNN